jgi:U4/U6.U5 tri-snRNP-associated protein 3
MQLDAPEADAPADADAAAMAAMMGFGGFGTTQGKAVAGNNDVGTSDVKKQRKWRQYMNRRGGFNR